MSIDMGMEWPELSETRDGPTIATLHLFSQVIGKFAVALLPWRNHGWHLTLHPDRTITLRDGRLA